MIAAPRAPASVILGRTKGRPRMSAQSWIQTSDLLPPPTARKSAISMPVGGSDSMHSFRSKVIPSRIPFRMSPLEVSSRNPATTPQESEMNSGGPVIVKWGSTTTRLGPSGISAKRSV